MSTRPKYSEDDDAVILEHCKEAEDNNKPLSTAFMVIADKLGRDPRSVENRFRRITGKDGAVSKKQRELTEEDVLILRLKSIGRERGRSAEKSKYYKDKHDEIKKQYDELLPKHNALQAAYDKLLKSVKDALDKGEDS